MAGNRRNTSLEKKQKEMGAPKERDGTGG